MLLGENIPYRVYVVVQANRVIGFILAKYFLHNEDVDDESKW